MAGPDPDWFADLARRLAADDQLDAVLNRVVQASRRRVAGAEHAGITMVTGRSVETPAATDPLVRDVDRLQYATGQGPCLAAAVERHRAVRVDDLGTDRRWPEFSAAAADLGVRSMLSLQLFTGAETIGALNLYAAAPHAFGDESVRIGSLLAAQAAAAAVAAVRTGNLRIALHTRDVIGQAKGILMERHKITAERAFDLMIGASQQTHRKLADVAADLAATGELTLDRKRSG